MREAKPLKKLLFLAVLASIAVPLLRAKSSDRAVTGLTEDCSLLFAEGISHGAQMRLRAFLHSSAKTAEERTATGMAAAVALTRSTGYDYAKIFLLPDEAPRERGAMNDISATVEHAPDPDVIPFMDARWSARATDAKWSDSFAFSEMTDMSEFALKIEGSAGPRSSWDPKLSGGVLGR